MAEHDSGRDGGMVDAEQFMRVSEALRVSFARLASASLTDSSRQRWQRRLIAVTNVAKHDLTRAEEQCQRFQADFEREVGGGGDVRGR
jgi:hypothetical protein